MEIRRFIEEDISEVVSLFYETVHAVNKQHYSKEQLDAWAPQEEVAQKLEAWKESMVSNITYIAEICGQIVGFADMTYGGELDRLYVHKNYQRRGVASAMLKKLEAEAGRLGVNEIRTDASITAKPFFERKGYRVVQSQIVERKGVKLDNFKMIKKL
ncbi:GNAT family N-acetyltransferase [Bacillus sp. FJAT-28004]|uniref:GNAT family N-acetyltransferase n=1 Tax=Bacillus sp. FJAT-28004 TaxID=1679165 RepID=UPI0006B4C906|nr:GNAT family N-acetyltransferase [Bacillus sp. FJAT-28004]